MNERLTILTGHVIPNLMEMEPESVDCIVTSPPYWGLRDYGMAGQLGLESTPAEYIENMTAVFELCRRVLKPSGTCWVNTGDSYSDRGGKPGNVNLGQPHADRYLNANTIGLKPKNLVGIPWRLAFALQDAGWYLRSEIIWAKPNPMPESVRDRPTKAHEQIFLLTKSPKYFYNADAIRTPFRPETKPLSFETMDYKRRDKYKTPDGWDTGPGGHGSFHRKGREKGKTRGHERTHEGLTGEWDGMSKVEQQANGANARTVWTIATKAYAKAHFATFPPEIPRRCILAGCPEGGVVLDPFLGSGTTAAVALELGRIAIGIELNPAYVELARERCLAVTPGMNFGGVAA